jgi:hypothetical protein
MIKIPDWQAFTRGFSDGRAGKPYVAHHCSIPTRPEYQRGYLEGVEYAKANQPERKESSMAKVKTMATPPKGPVLVVNVTTQIMDHARVRDSSHCMIAMAIRDVAPQMASIAVDIQTIRFTDREKGWRYSYLTPRIAQKALIDFDQGVMPEPFNFRLGGAHVTKMTHKLHVQTPREMTDGQKEAVAKMRKVLRGNDPMAKASIMLDHEGNGEQPRRLGGTLPPLSRFARRREFGLKALKQ